MNEPELKPCKCGCKAELVDSQTFAWCNVYYYVRCTNPDCEEQTMLKYDHKVDAINAWNAINALNRCEEYDNSPDPLWCEDCKHFCNADMGGEGMCDIDNHDTWYGCPICEKAELKGDNNEHTD